MRHIGIVACSAEGAALCYQSIVHQAGDLLGENHHPRVTLDSIPLATWMPAFDSGDDVGLAAIMLESAETLASAGCELLICPDNSAHSAWPYLTESPLPWLHIGQVLAEEASRRGYGTVGVLGTRFTMNGPMYPEALSAVGISAVLPSHEQRQLVDRIIFDELIHGIVRDEARQAYQEVIRALAEQGCDAVALACTEIPLLIKPGDSQLPILDSTRLLAAAALEHALS